MVDFVNCVWLSASPHLKTSVLLLPSTFLWELLGLSHKWWVHWFNFPNPTVYKVDKTTFTASSYHLH